MDHVTPLLQIVLGYAAHVALATLAELALVLGPFALLALLAQPATMQAERWTEGLVGRRARWLAVGWLATSLHEAGHAVFALLFGHRVRRVKWFDFDAEGGTLGQVEHDYDPSSHYQRVGRFFIGLGPILLGALVLAVAARLLLGARPAGSVTVAPTAGSPTLGALAVQLGAAARDVAALAAAMRPERWQTWTFLYVAWVAGSAMRLSGSDARSCASGARTLLCFLVLANALTLWAGAAPLAAAAHAARAMALCDAALLAAVVLQVVVGVVALALTRATGALRDRSVVPARG